MLTLFSIFLVIAVLVFAGIIAHRRLSANPVKKFDPERELYQQLLKSARARAICSDSSLETFVKSKTTLVHGLQRGIMKIIKSASPQLPRKR